MSERKKDNILEVKDLTISFRTNNGLVRAVRDISFEVERGKTLAIVGESGSGKSVTSKAILGISAGNAIVDSGEILYDGMDLLKIGEDDMYKLRGDNIAMIFQDPLSSLNPIVKIGKQITEAMILKNKTSRKEAKNEFNSLLEVLRKNIAEATGDEAKASELTKKFDNMSIQALKLESSYNASKVYAEELEGSIEDFLFLVEKKQSVDTKAWKKELTKKLSQIDDSLLRKFTDEKLKTLSDKLSNCNFTIADDKLDEETSATLVELKSVIEEMISGEQPDTMGLAHLSESGQNDLVENASSMAEINDIVEEKLQNEFLNEFKEYAKKGVENSYRKSIEGKKAVLSDLKEAGEYYKGEFTKKDGLNKAKELNTKLNSAIDQLQTKKDSYSYTFGSTIKNEIEKYFYYLKNNPKEEARYAKQTAKREAQIAKGKTIDWKVQPKVVYDTDELKADISETPLTLASHYESQINDADNVDFDEKTDELIAYFRKTASKSIEKVTKTTAREKAIRLMEEVGIPEPRIRYDQYPFEFSGGMRQRIVIAIALSANPEILICDEPTTALDVTIQAQILELINKLKEERNLSIIFITHDLGVVANMADEIAVMYAGKIVEKGTADDIFYDPRHPYTWALLSSMPDLDTDEKLDAIPGTPPNMIYPPEGDAFAARNKYALDIDFEQQPPMFKVSDTHYAATWLLHPNAPKVELPKTISERIARMKKLDEQLEEENNG